MSIKHSSELYSSNSITDLWSVVPSPLYHLNLTLPQTDILEGQINNEGRLTHIPMSIKLGVGSKISNKHWITEWTVQFSTLYLSFGVGGSNHDISLLSFRPIPAKGWGKLTDFWGQTGQCCPCRLLAGCAWITEAFNPVLPPFGKKESISAIHQFWIPSISMRLLRQHISLDQLSLHPHSRGSANAFGVLLWGVVNLLWNGYMKGWPVFI